MVVAEATKINVRKYLLSLGEVEGGNPPSSPACWRNRALVERCLSFIFKSRNEKKHDRNGAGRASFQVEIFKQ